MSDECDCGILNPSDCKGCKSTDPAQVAKNAQLALEVVRKNRKEGLQKLEDKVQSLMENETLTVENMPVAVVSALRDVVVALNAALVTVDAEQKLADMIISDMINLTKNLDIQAKNGFVTSGHLQTLLSLLESKGIISEEGMRETWEKLMNASNPVIEKP